MRNRLLICTALACAAFALVLTGCGGDDDSTTTTEAASGATGGESAALTVDEFVAEGNAICAAGNDDLDALANETFTAEQPTADQIEQFAGVLVVNVQGQIDALRALSPPEELAGDVDTFLSDAEEVLGQVEADPALLETSDSSDPFIDVNAQAEELGLIECAG